MKRIALSKIKRKVALGVSLALNLGLSSVQAAEVINVEDNDSGTYSTLVGLLGQSGYAEGTDFDVTVNQSYGEGVGVTNGLSAHSPTEGNFVTGDNKIQVTANSAIGLRAIISYSDNESSTRTVQTGDNLITVNGRSGAIGMDSMSLKNQAITQLITGDNKITATAVADGSYTFAVGIRTHNTLGHPSNNMANITTGENDVTVTATGRHEESASSPSLQATAYAYGIMAHGAGDITTENNEITVTASGGAVKNLGTGDATTSATAIGLGNNMGSVDNGHTVISTGDNIIHVTANGGTAESSKNATTRATAYGIHMKYYSLSYAEENRARIGKSDIRAIAIGGETIAGQIGSTSATAVGMYVYGSNPNGSETSIIATGAQSIYTEATAGTVNGVASGEAYAYALLSSYTGEIILDNQGESVQLTGDIGSYYGNNTVSLDHEDSYWRPRFQDSIVIGGYRVANGSFGSGSFTIENGGTLDVAWYANQNGYDFRNTSLTLTGNQININDGATFIINSDIVNNEADTITANTTATGTQYVRVVYDPSMYQNGIYQTGTVNGIALVLDFAGANGQGITSTVDTALDVIEITPQMEGGYLKAITVTGPDTTDPGNPDTTPEALKTVSDFYQHQMNILKLEGNNSFMRRMGDVRLEDPEKHKGVWAHTFGGKLKFDGAYGRNSTQKYYGVEAGFDYNKEVQSGRLYYGPLVSYRKADSNYNRGSGDIESLALGGYVSWVSPKGHYVDVVMKAVHLDTDYHLYSNRNDGGDSERISADFGNWSYLMSGEYGYRHDLSSRTFIEPQAMLTLGRLSGKGYTASNGVRFQQEGMNLAVGRLSLLYGVNVGKEKNSNVYVKGSLIHDFSSTGGVTANYQGRSRLIDTAGDTGTSFELNVGANLQLSKKNQLYFELTKSFGGDVETDWQVNAGWQIRW